MFIPFKVCVACFLLLAFTSIARASIFSQSEAFLFRRTQKQYMHIKIYHHICKAIPIHHSHNYASILMGTCARLAFALNINKYIKLHASGFFSLPILYNIVTRRTKRDVCFFLVNINPKIFPSPMKRIALVTV